MSEAVLHSVAARVDVVNINPPRLLCTRVFWRVRVHALSKVLSHVTSFFFTYLNTPNPLPSFSSQSVCSYCFSQSLCSSCFCQPLCSSCFCQPLYSSCFCQTMCSSCFSQSVFLLFLSVLPVSVCLCVPFFPPLPV